MSLRLVLRNGNIKACIGSAAEFHVVYAVVLTKMMIFVSPQLSQAAASIDNRVPTPSSVASAETNSQQPGPEAPMLEMKAEVKTEDPEPDASESKGEPGSAVGAVPGREQMCSTSVPKVSQGEMLQALRGQPCLLF